MSLRFELSIARSRAFGAGVAALVLFGAAGCTTQINTLKKAAMNELGVAGMTSLQITDASPTRAAPLSLAWGVTVGAYDAYCILENATDPAGCVWQTGALPTSYADSASDGPLALSAFLKNGAGVSPVVVSNSVTIDRTAPTLASATVLNASPSLSRGFLLDYGALSETIAHYCVLENDTDVSHCSWTAASALPDRATVTAAQAAKTLSIWTRDAAGNTSIRTDTNAVNYANTLAISPANSAIARAYASESVDGMRTNGVVVKLDDGRILYAGGCRYSNLDRHYTIAKIYDPVADAWSYAGHMHQPRCFAGFAKLADGRVLVSGGQIANGTSTATAEIFDPATGKWLLAAPMSAARGRHTATLLASGKVLVAGGLNGTSASIRNTTELYDPAANVWLAGPTMSSVRYDHRAARLADGKVLLVGGMIAANDSTTSADLFTPAGHTGTLAATGALAGKRAYFSLETLTAAQSPSGNEAVIVFGGTTTGAAYVATVELYDTASATWTGKTAITTARRSIGSTKLTDGRIFLIGGYNGGYRSEAALYDPLAAAGAGTYSAQTALGISTDALTPIQIANGRILFTGGGGSYNAENTGYMFGFDPGTGAWDNFAARRPFFVSTSNTGGHAAQLPDGRVLICGGRSSAGSEFAYCEIYDPAKSVILPTSASPSGYRGQAPIVMLDDGRAMVVAGAYGGLSIRRNDSSLYDPTTDAWTTTATAPYYVGITEAVALSGNRMLMVAGHGPLANSGTPTNRTAVYDATANTWTSTGGMNYPLSIIGHRVVKTAGGRVFAYGGWTGAAATATLNEWNDGTSQWVARTASSVARHTHALVLVPGGTEGKLVAIGGYTDAYTTRTASVEIYDVGTDTWSNGAALPFGVDGPCAAYHPALGEIILSHAGILGNGQRYSVVGDTWTAGHATQIWRNGNYNGSPTQCGVLDDGRYFLGGHGPDESTFELWTVATRIAYSATQGDGNLLFALLSGAGFLDERRVFTPDPALPSGTSVIQVSDGGAQTANGNAVAP